MGQLDTMKQSHDRRGSKAKVEWNFNKDPCGVICLKNLQFHPSYLCGEPFRCLKSSKFLCFDDERSQRSGNRKLLNSRVPNSTPRDIESRRNNFFDSSSSKKKKKKNTIKKIFILSELFFPFFLFFLFHTESIYLGVIKLQVEELNNRLTLIRFHRSLLLTWAITKKRASIKSSREERGTGVKSMLQESKFPGKKKGEDEVRLE